MKKWPPIEVALLFRGSGWVQPAYPEPGGAILCCLCTFFFFSLSFFVVMLQEAVAGAASEAACDELMLFIRLQT